MHSTAGRGEAFPVTFSLPGEVRPFPSHCQPTSPQVNPCKLSLLQPGTEPEATLPQTTHACLLAGVCTPKVCWSASAPHPTQHRCVQAQSFFAALPQAIAARLRAAACIPTQDGEWVVPGQAMVCQSPAVATLLSDTRLAGTLDLRYAHSGLAALQDSRPLRALLGVPEVAHEHLLEVAQRLQAQVSSC